MFHTKSKKEQLQEQSASLADTAVTVADQLRERVAPAVVHAAENAKEWGQPRVEAAREWAKPRVEHGIEIAAPKLESAVSGLAPKVDTARDKIVDELLPRVNEAITAWAAASGAAKDEAVSRGSGAAAVISGDAVATPKRRGRKRRALLVLGVVGAAGAAANAFMKKSAPKDDPWATPLADPYVAPSNGRHAGLAPVRDTGEDTTRATEPDAVADSPNGDVIVDAEVVVDAEIALDDGSAAGAGGEQEAGAVQDGAVQDDAVADTAEPSAEGQPAKRPRKR